MQPQNAWKVALVGLGLGLASALPLLIVFFGTHERREYQDVKPPTVKESVRALFGNRPFFFAVGIFLFTNTALSVIQSILLYFLKYRMNMESQSDFVMGTVFIVALIFLPLWIWASEHSDKRIAYIIGMVFFSVVMIVMISASPSWPSWIIYALAALAGIGTGAMYVLPWAMIPDAIEWDEVKTGARHEGMFYSFVTLIGKVDGSIALPLMLLVLQWSGYNANAAVQSDRTVWAIRIMTGPVPSVFLCLGILFAVFYPLTRTRHAELRAELAARRAAEADAAATE
jgi:GPH family glycoside/pentoside/hexuronide:cation symporter